MVDVDSNTLPADSQTKSVGLVYSVDGHMALSPHSSNEPVEPKPWPRHDNSAIYIVIIIITRALQPVATCRQSPYIRLVSSATKPAILIMTLFAPRPALQTYVTYGHLTVFNI